MVKIRSGSSGRLCGRFRGRLDGPGIERNQNLGADGRDLLGIGGEGAVGVVRGARDRQVEDGARKVGDGDQVALVGGITVFLVIRSS